MELWRGIAPLVTSHLIVRERRRVMANSLLSFLWEGYRSGKAWYIKRQDSQSGSLEYMVNSRSNENKGVVNGAREDRREQWYNIRQGSGTASCP